MGLQRTSHRQENPPYSGRKDAHAQSAAIRHQADRRRADDDGDHQQVPTQLRRPIHEARDAPLQGNEGHDTDDVAAGTQAFNLRGRVALPRKD